MKFFLLASIFFVVACVQQADAKPAIAEAGLADAYRQIDSFKGLAGFRQVVAGTNSSASFSYYSLLEAYLNKNKLVIVEAHAHDGIRDYGRGVVTLTNELIEKSYLTSTLKELLPWEDYTTNFSFYDSESDTYTNAASNLSEYGLYKLLNVGNKGWISPLADGQGTWLPYRNPSFINGDTYYIKIEDDKLIFIKVIINKDKSVSFEDDPLYPYLKNIYTKK